MGIEDGGAAFPEVKTNFDAMEPFVYSDGGMTLRDYFAAKELGKVNGVSICDEPALYDRLADHCYRMADAMLRARK